MVAYRVEVLSVFMEVGIPVEKIRGKMRKLLEYGRYALTDESHMRNYIPEVGLMQIANLKEHFQSPTPLVCAIFDSTSHGVELFPISVRFWSRILKRFLQKLIRFRIIDVPMNAILTAAVLKGAFNRVGISHVSSIGALHDSANVNPAAVSKLTEQDWLNALDLPCHSHILSRIGKKLGVPRAQKLIHDLCTVFNKSGKVAAEWRAYQPAVGSLIRGRTVAIPRLSNIRWYNEHEVCALIMEVITLPRVVDFVSRGMTAMPPPNDEDDDFMSDLKKTQKALIHKLKEGLRNEIDYQAMRLELCVFLHYGRPLAKWCYFLEGDYPTLPHVSAAYREIEQALSPSTFLVPCLILWPILILS
jgi:hypothetical protein